MLLNSYDHHYIDTHFTFSILGSMSRPRSIYVVFMMYFFIFSLIFIAINHTTSYYLITILKQTHLLVGNKEKQRYIDKSICLLATRFKYYPVRIIKPFYYF